MKSLYRAFLQIRFIRYLLLLFFLIPVLLDARIWTDRDGRVIDAELLEILDDKIRIKRKDGREFTAAISIFSEADREFVEKERAARREVEEKPKPENDKGWPRTISFHKKPNVEIVEENGNRFIYRTPHFEFHSDVRLSRNLVADLGHVFESTYFTLKSLPLNLISFELKSSPFKTRLFSKTEDYHQAGGIPGSGGLYQSASRTILIPTENLGVKASSSGFTFDRYADNRVLIHEITHQIMDPWLSRIPVWFVEGIAVYMETAAGKTGEFKFVPHLLEEYLVRYTPYRNGPLPILPVERLMAKSYPDWNRAFESESEMVGRNYHSALLLTYYFFHLDDDPSRIRRFLNLPMEQIGSNPNEILLDGRDSNELQADLLKKFRRIGIRLTVE